MSEKVTPGTRLFNLACALLYTSHGLSKEEIFSRVSGYSEQYDRFGDKTALTKVFERDKELLREAGIMVEAVNPPEAMGDKQTFVYRVSKQEFLWPKGLHLTPRQIELLNLAATVWAGASLSRDAASAALRIRGLGEIEDLSELAGLAPRIRTHHPSFAAFSAAIEAGQEVSFQYRKPGDVAPETRKFHPWQLQNVWGQWLVLGYDLVGKEPRSFLLRRVIGDVQIGKSEPKFCSEDELKAAQGSLQAFIDSNEVTLKIKPNTGAWFRFEMDDKPQDTADEVTFNFMDVHLLADDLRQYAGEIEVLRPKQLRDLIEAGFEKVVEIHHG
jgi:proteasome accessory factor B